MFDEFKQHAEKFHEDMKSLELSYEVPGRFFGTTTRHQSATKILNEELQYVKVAQNEIKKFSVELEEMNNISEQLLNNVDEITQDMSNITQMLEKFGFVFSVGNTETINEEEDNKEEDCITEDLPAPLLEKLHVTDGSNGNSSDNDVEGGISLTECVEQYLEENHIELDDLVTPYIQRKSLYMAKKSN